MMGEECCYCDKPVAEPVLAPGRASLYCHPECITDTCMTCGETIRIDENYQFCGNDSFLCQACGYDRKQCAECEELITDESDQVRGEHEYYHAGCVPAD